jgi:methyl-accepting chemotaxis protein
MDGFGSGQTLFARRLAVMRDLSVRTKIIGAFACVLIATIALGLFGLQRMWVMNTHARAIGTEWFPSAKVMHELSYLTSRVRLKEATYLLESSDEAREMRLREVKMLDRKVTKTLEETRRLATGDEDAKRASDLQAKWRKYREQEAELVTQQAADPVSAYVFFTGEYKNTFDEFRNVLEQIVASNNDLGAAQISQSESAWASARLLILLVLCAAIALCISAGLLLIEAISAPLGRMTEAVAELAAGNLNAHVPHTDQKDEIGKLAGTMASFKNQLAEAERSKAQQTEVIVSSIGKGLDHLAKGDLTHRISAALAGPFVKLKEDFNDAMGRLQETIRHVIATTGQIATGADEIAHAADDLSRRTEHQAASLEQTAAALQQITVNVKEAAANSKQVNSSMAWAKTAAEEGGSVVEAATGAMDAISHSSSKITDIIGVIDEIAFQTNLLALNAGVEAARAGDAGKGFAVVASEVRALAQRSSQAAKEIKALIQESGAQVSRGVTLVAETGSALTSIATKVHQINAVMNDMTQAAEQEATGIEQVNIAVGQMDEVTQQNAAMVEQTTAASRGLAAETQELQTLIGFFNVGEAAPASRKAA